MSIAINNRYLTNFESDKNPKLNNVSCKLPEQSLALFFVVSIVWLLYVTSKKWLAGHDEVTEDSHLDSLKPCRVNIVDSSQQLPRSNYTYQSLPCLLTKTEPSFHICTYPSKRDRFISAALQSDGIWEPYITPILQGALNKYPNSILMDVGANIGYYSLLAAKMGHLAIAIEPKKESLRRLQMGVELNRVRNEVYLVQNALYDFHTNVTLTDSEDNQGGVWIKSIISKSKGSLQNESLVEAITMDHLLTVTNIKQAVLKLDIGKPINLYLFISANPG